MSLYAPLKVRVTTPRLELLGATDDLLESLAPLVADGKATAEPPPWDDPSAFYEPDPEIRVQQWLRAVWRSRGTVRPDAWRLNFVAVIDGEPVGQQDLTGNDFDDFGTVESTSWVSSDFRRRGIGSAMRSAILHLAFDGLGAAEAHSEGAFDNAGSNAVSERLGYERNGKAWATHQGKPVLGQRWLLDRETWQGRRRDDITMSGVTECRQALGIEPVAGTCPLHRQPTADRPTSDRPTSARPPSDSSYQRASEQANTAPERHFRSAMRSMPGHRCSPRTGIGVSRVSWPPVGRSG